MSQDKDYVVIASDDVHEVINQIADLAASIGWAIALPDEDYIDNMILGVPGALHELNRTLECYDVFVPPELERH